MTTRTDPRADLFRQLDAQRMQLAPRAIALLEAAARQELEHLTGQAAGSPADLDYDPRIWELALFRIWVSSGSVWYRVVIEQIEGRNPGKIDPGDLTGNAGAMRRFFRRARDRAAELTEITRRSLERLVAAAATEIGVDAALAMLYASGEFAKIIKNIATDEMLTATQAAGAEAARATQTIVVKEWLSRRDDAVRPAHSDADAFYSGSGAIIETERFSVGGESLAYPKDPAGSPGNIINCRCQAIYREVPLDERGNPLP